MTTQDMAVSGTSDAAGTGKANQPAPAISVVIPVYNRAYVLPRALKSVLDQTLQDYEVIVVDDGSNDDPGAVINALGDPRIHLVQHPRNMGTAAARNTGVRAARGEYIAFLDSDDIWKAAKLERQLAMLSSAPPDVIAVTTGFVMKRENDDVQTIRQPRDASGPERFLAGCDVSPGSTLMVRRQLFDQVGDFDTGFIRLEDWDWLLKALKWGRLVVLREPLAVIFLGGRPAFAKVRNSISRLLEQNLPWLTARNPANRRLFLSGCYYELSAAAYWEGGIASAIKYYSIYLYFSPFRTLPGRALQILRICRNLLK